MQREPLDPRSMSIHPSLHSAQARQPPLPLVPSPMFPPPPPLPLPSPNFPKIHAKCHALVSSFLHRDGQVKAQTHHIGTIFQSFLEEERERVHCFSFYHGGRHGSESGQIDGEATYGTWHKAWEQLTRHHGMVGNGVSVSIR